MTLIEDPSTDATRRLPDHDTLAGFRDRARVADEHNEYFHEDLAVLREIGYLGAAVPEELGGWGYDLRQLGRAQRRLATYAPATALAMTMHHYWVGIAVEYERAGDPSLRWILERAVAGDVFAAGHAETGNDAPVVMSTATAVKVDGGYVVNGHKMFGSNGPAWAHLGVHALDTSTPDQPVVVHGFVPREAPGVTVVPNWDTLGMRPSQSYDTVLDDVFVPDDRIGAITPAGDESDLFLFAMNLWFVGQVGNVYLGIAERALELAVHSATTKSSVAIPRGTYAHNPMVQHQVAEMYLEFDAADATVRRFVDDCVDGVDHGDRWGAKIVSAKWRAVEAAKRVVDVALDVAGGAGMVRGHELERLYRDVRCGGFHPTNDALTHETAGKALLGIDPAGPRW
ncbi:acyl-CoA dehydrogenase family protein [Rhabdothermincola salaria]|uniref:acyl-CoA dehydrogenase family protein n=1 Tax=Rhabdothermincola salaria TaxID=2903142 RepID=UPI001E4ED689|nr:acyl-CoA dehydrogenase family protein [Rhabdothermincola salaria]MCD9625681.1 acyl-CoA/acyl-ACP dehydrogenase [Rhabdothermincola salaria]